MVVTSLRRRGLLRPIVPGTNDLDKHGRSLAAEDNSSGSSSGSGNIFDHYVSPCEYRVSNDPLLVSDEELCDATLYGCVRDHTFLIQANDEIKEVDIQYDYDMYYKFDSEVHDFQEMVEFLEGTMLEHMASLLDLKQCPPSYLSSARGPHRKAREITRRLEGFTEKQMSSVVAINSEPRDLRSDYECVTPPEEGTMCQSMLGRMTVYVEQARLSTSNRAELESAVLAAIQLGMESNVYTKGVITNLTYIGDRSLPELELTTAPLAQSQSPSSLSTLSPGSGLPPETPEGPYLVVAGAEREKSSSDQGGSLNGTEIGLVSAAAGFFVLVALLGLLLTSRRRKVESTTNQHIPRAKLEDEDDAALGEMSGSSRSRSGKHVRVVSNLGRQWSLEGSEIPGSLAAMDALALKPQFLRNGDTAVSLSDSERSAPRTPPRIERAIPTPPSSSLGIEIENLEGRKSPRVFSETSLTSVPLSPVRNDKSGVSPSRVSPKRLLSPFNEPFVAARYKERKEESLKRPVTTPGRIGSDTIRALQSIATSSSTGSGSFQDQSVDL